MESETIDESESAPAEVDEEPTTVHDTKPEAAEQSEDAPSDDSEVPVIEAVTEPEVAEAAESAPADVEPEVMESATIDEIGRAHV